jgi:hypothetical protein
MGQLSLDGQFLGGPTHADVDVFELDRSELYSPLAGLGGNSDIYRTPVFVSALAREFGVDRHSIRRDLEDVEARG